MELFRWYGHHYANRDHGTFRQEHDQNLTDVPAILRGHGKRVAVYTAELNEQILGVNTPEQLALTEKYLRK